ncbi:MAG: YlzJ-like family protein [bacterium]
MILYTTMPLENVYQGLEDMRPSYLEVEMAGTMVVVEPIGLNQGRIVRILSTDPQDYLHPGLQPGRIINFVPGGGLGCLALLPFFPLV